MNDKELLELAALAAGYNVSFFSARNQRGFTCGFTNAKDGGDWNPIDNDGDALRLAVKLELDVMCGSVRTEDFSVQIPIKAGTEMYAATRYAIVRAAAEIGSSMKGQK